LLARDLTSPPGAYRGARRRPVTALGSHTQSPDGEPYYGDRHISFSDGV
jgi:hypothetical protein